MIGECPCRLPARTLFSTNTTMPQENRDDHRCQDGYFVLARGMGLRVDGSGMVLLDCEASWPWVALEHNPDERERNEQGAV